MINEFYDLEGFIKARERAIKNLGEEKFYKLSKRKQAREIELEYLAQLLVEIYLDQE